MTISYIVLWLLTMRTIVDIPVEMIEKLDLIGSDSGISRAAVVREAVAEYLDKRASKIEDSEAFGIWSERPVNGLKFQEKIRSEWTDEGRI